MDGRVEKLVRESRLKPQEEKVVKETLIVIAQPECRGGESPSCTTTEEYYGAWKKLSQTSPTLGLKLLSQGKEFPRWPKAAFYFHTTRRLPEGAAPQISEELWNKAMAYRWIVRNFEPGAAGRIKFLEDTIPQDDKDGLVLLAIAKTNMLGITEDERAFLTTAEATFKASDEEGSRQKLSDQILHHLYYDVELREALSRPIE